MSSRSSLCPTCLSRPCPSSSVPRAPLLTQATTSEEGSPRRWLGTLPGPSIAPALLAGQLKLLKVLGFVCLLITSSFLSPPPTPPPPPPPPPSFPPPLALPSPVAMTARAISALVPAHPVCWATGAGPGPGAVGGSRAPAA
eukprot:756558-Hanusia_phi.AAC.1